MLKIQVLVKDDNLVIVHKIPNQIVKVLETLTTALNEKKTSSNTVNNNSSVEVRRRAFSADHSADVIHVTNAEVEKRGRGTRLVQSLKGFGRQ